MLVYIHFPFCRSKCSYCGFCSYLFEDRFVQRYVDYLLREIGLWGQSLSGQEISTIYIGGGTPSLLRAKELERIFEALGQYFRFSEKMEISMEANPDSVSRQYLQEILRLGVNRLSLGVQSLDDQDLYILNRRHGRDQAMQACFEARNAGFENLNVDLIWGLPEQGVQKWLEQLNLVIQHGVTHVSCYNLTLEPGTRLEEMVQNREIVLPDESEQGKMFVYGAQYLEEQGLLHYEISNFSRMGYMCWHNLGYWEGRDYIGMGPSAVSTIKGVRVVHPQGLQEYESRIARGGIWEDSEQMDPGKRKREFVMLRLRTVKGMNLREYKELTGDDFCREKASILQALRRNDLIRLRKGYVSLTKSGMLVSDSILSHLI